jgi:uncharacterized protein YkwD
MRIRLFVATLTAVVAGAVAPALVQGAPVLVQGTPAALDSAAGSGQLRRAVRLNPPKPPPPPAVVPQQVVLDLVNAERAAHNLAPMVVDARLQLAAQRHSEDQAAMRRMSHVGSDGSSMVQRIDRVGFPWRSAAENVAVGFSTPQSVMAAWMNSPGHRTNILSANTHIGVGLATGSDGRIYWTQVFGALR